MTTGIIGLDPMVYAGYSTIPEKFQAAIRSGIGFFELRTDRPINFGRQINGPFSVAVNEEFDSVSRKAYYNTTWHTGELARVRFEPQDQKTGMAAGYMPDDHWWHNRIMVAYNSDLRLIQAYHSRDGMFPGTHALEEIDCLYRACTVEAREFVIVNGMGRIIGSFKTKGEAEKDVAENKYKNHEIRERSIRVNSELVENLIREWRTIHRSRNGWTDNPKFAAIREKVTGDIQARRGAKPSAGNLGMSDEQFGDAIISAIRRMPIGERKALLHEVTERQVHENVFNGKPSNKLPIQDLRKRAKELGIEVKPRMNRLALIKLLREKGEQIIDESAKVATEELHRQPAQPDPQTPEQEEFVT